MREGTNSGPTIAEMMAAGFGLWRRRWGDVTALMLLLFLVGGLIMALTRHLFGVLVGGSFAVVPQAPLPEGSNSFVFLALNAVLSGLVLCILRGLPQIAMSVVAVTGGADKNISLLVALRRAAPHLPSLVALSMVVSCCATFCAIVALAVVDAANYLAGGNWITALKPIIYTIIPLLIQGIFSFAPSCCVIEGLGPIASLRRAVQLSGGARVNIWGLLILLVVVSHIITVDGRVWAQLVLGHKMGSLCATVVLVLYQGFMPAVLGASYALLYQKNGSPRPRNLAMVFE